MREGAAGPQWGRGSPGPAARGAAGSRVEWALSGGSRRLPSGQRLCRHAAGTETPRAVGAAGGPGAAAVSSVPRRAPPGEGGVSPRSPGEESPARAEQRGAQRAVQGACLPTVRGVPSWGGRVRLHTALRHVCARRSAGASVPLRVGVQHSASRSPTPLVCPAGLSPGAVPRRGVPLGPRPFRVVSWRVRQRTLAPFAPFLTVVAAGSPRALPGRAGRAVRVPPPHALCSLSSTILEEEKAQQEERMRMESRRQVAVSWDSGGPDEAPPKVAGAPAGVG